jgi:hypothetical protein
MALRHCYFARIAKIFRVCLTDQTQAIWFASVPRSIGVSENFSIVVLAL